MRHDAEEERRWQEEMAKLSPAERNREGSETGEAAGPPCEDAVGMERRGAASRVPGRRGRLVHESMAKGGCATSRPSSFGAHQPSFRCGD